MPDMKGLLKTVIIGAGSFGTKRLEACLSMPGDFRVVGVVDPSSSRQQTISQTFRIPTFGSLAELKETPDFAIISTPNRDHVAVSVETLKRGMHVLCEKPLAPTLRGARQIATAARIHKRFLKTGSNHRFFHTVQKAKELYENGSIGKLLHFRASIGINGQRVAGKWFWDPSISGGGSFIDNGCHVLDIARMFMGSFVSCSAYMTNVFWKKASVEDLGSAIFVTKDKRHAVITSSWIQWAGYLHIELWGEKGYIIIDSTTHDTVQVGGKSGICTTYDYSNEPKTSYHRELLYMKECIFGGKQPQPNGDDGAAVIAMIESAYASSKKKTWVNIPQ